MISYHGINKEKSFFQAWYFKQQCKNFIISFMPGIVMSKEGEKKAFIKVEYNERDIYLEYPFSDFSFEKGKIKIAENEFSEKGIKIDISNEKIKIKGKLSFSRIVYLKKNKMNSSKIMKAINTTHEIISVRYYLNGILNINNHIVNFIDGVGYSESLFGKKMSKEGMWIQCSDKYNYSLMVSVEPMKKIGIKSLGCVAFIYCNGIEYRFSTFRGAKVLTYNSENLVIKQGGYYLKITFTERGNTSVLFKIRKKTIFQYNSDKCSYKDNIKKYLTG